MALPRQVYNSVNVIVLMVNQVILNYFRENRAAHSLEDLKAKALSSGYPREDVDEVLEVLREGIDKTAAPVIRKEGVKRTGLKWMKYSGIFGIMFFVLGVLNFVASFFEFNLGTTFGVGNEWVALGISAVAVVLVCFYFYGFFRMGVVTDSKLLRVIAVVNIVMMVIMVLLVIFMVLGFFTPDESSLSGMETGIVEWILQIFWIVIWIVLFLFVLRVIFSISLIRVRDKIKFSMTAGILGLITIALTVVYIGFLVYIMLEPMRLLQFAFSSFWTSIIPIYGIVFSLFNLSTLLFESLALFDGSKKFE